MSTTRALLGSFLVAIAIAMATGPSAQAEWTYKFCGTMRWGGAAHEVQSGSAAKPVKCATARMLLRRHLRTKRRRIGSWRCSGGGGNPAVLADCRRRDFYVVAYDARHGE